MKNLFADSTKKVEKAPVAHVKTAEELETEKLVAHQKEMLQQEKMRLQDKKDVSQELGETREWANHHHAADAFNTVQDSPVTAGMSSLSPIELALQQASQQAASGARTEPQRSDV